MYLCSATIKNKTLICSQGTVIFPPNKQNEYLPPPPRRRDYDTLFRRRSPNIKFPFMGVLKCCSNGDTPPILCLMLQLSKQMKTKMKMKLHNGLMLSLAIIASFCWFLCKGDFANQVSFLHNPFIIEM